MPYVGQVILNRSPEEYRESLLRDADSIRTYNTYRSNGDSLLTISTYEEFVDAIVTQREQLTEEQRSKLSKLDTWQSAQGYLARIVADKLYADHRILDEKIITDPDRVSEIISSKSQCLLIENIPKLVLTNFDSQYKNFTILHDKAETIVTNVNGPTKIEPFWSVTPEQFARFQPLARIFKSYHDNSGKTKYVVEMPFGEFMTEDNLSSLTESSISRGVGVGLVGIDWNLMGTNPAESKNVVEAELKFRFDSLQEMARERIVKASDGSSQKVSFLDFFVLAGTNKKDKCNEQDPNTYDVNSFSFKMLVGWNELTNMFEPNRSGEMKALNKAVKQDQRLFRLTMTNHDLDISEEGPVELTIKAIASLDAIAYTEESNIFKQFVKDTTLVSTQNSIKRVTEGEECIDEDDFTDAQLVAHKKENEALVKELEGVLAEQKTKVWSGFLTSLSESNRMWLIQSSKEAFGITRTTSGKVGIFESDGEQLGSFMGPYVYEGQTSFKVPAGDDLQKSTDDIQNEIDEKKEKEIEFDASITTINVPYMYLGDIIDIALNALNSENNKFMQDDNQRIFLGDIVYYDPNDRKKYSVNLADIPISFDLFKQWFVQHVFKPQRVFYPVKEFLSDFLESVVYEMFKPNKCFLNTPKRRLKLSFSGFSYPSFDGNDPLNPEGKLRMRVDDIQKNKDKASAISANGRDKKYFEYLMIYNSDIAPTQMEANYERDLKQGIPWAFIGRDRGLIKNIKFSRADLPYVRESRISQGSTEFAKLRERYTAKIDMIGNNMLYPGQFLFINPSTVVLGNVTNAAALAATIGLVGYYQVISVTNSITPGDYSTTINANWTSGGYKQEELGGPISPATKKDRIAKDLENYEFVLLAPWSVSIPEVSAAIEEIFEDISSSGTVQSAKKFFTPLANMFKRTTQ